MRTDSDRLVGHRCDPPGWVGRLSARVGSTEATADRPAERAEHDRLLEGFAAALRRSARTKDMCKQCRPLLLWPDSGVTPEKGKVV